VPVPLSQTTVRNNSASSSATTEVKYKKSANFLFIVKYWRQVVAEFEEAEII
jgi:hypothetical protein